MPAAVINLDAIQTAVCRGVVEGVKPLVTAIVAERDDRHDLRNIVQTNVSKVYELDGEVKLLKGVMVTLVGNGDGSSGMVPRLERDLKTVGEDVASLASDVRDVTTTVNAMAKDIKALVSNKDQSQNFMAGWKGALTLLTVIGALVTIIAFLLGRGFHI